MSCISSNFSSFFLNSLNDPSEFAKYLSNGELKFSSFEDFQAFGGNNAATATAGSGNGVGTGAMAAMPASTLTGTQYSTQQQQLQQQQQLNGNNAAFYNNNASSGAAGTAGGHTNQSSTEAFNGVAVGTAAAVAAVAAAAAATTANGVPHHHAHHQLDGVNNYSTHAVPTTQQQQLHQQQQQQQQQQHASQQHLQHPPHTPVYLSAAAAAAAAAQQHASNAAAGFHHPNHLATTVAAAAASHHPHTHAPSHTHAHPQHLPASNNMPPLQHNPQSPYATTAAAQRWPTAIGTPGNTATHINIPASSHGTSLHSNHHVGTPLNGNAAAVGAQHFDGSFEFLKYLRHSNDFNNSAATNLADSNEHATNATAPHTPTSHQQHQLPHQQQQSSSLIDLDSSTSHNKSRSSRKVVALLSSVSRASNSLDSNTLDVFDHDSKHTIFDMHHITNSSNSNESSMEMSNVAFPNSHLNASNSNTSSEGAAAGSSEFSILNTSAASSAPKPLASFIIKDNFDVHASHKVEEGIFQHMNKLPPKKKENLKQLGVRFTGQMTLTDKSIVVENFIKFCQDYDVQDHRPFLSLNQSGLNKPEQIKFARYLGQGLPTFTLFCIYSNFKNLFCTKRTEIYTKDGYNLPYILDKTKRFLSNTTAGNTNTQNKQTHSAPTPSTSLLSTATGTASTTTTTTTTTATVIATSASNSAIITPIAPSVQLQQLQQHQLQLPQALQQQTIQLQQPTSLPPQLGPPAMLMTMGPAI